MGAVLALSLHPCSGRRPLHAQRLRTPVTVEFGEEDGPVRTALLGPLRCTAAAPATCFPRAKSACCAPACSFPVGSQGNSRDETAFVLLRDGVNVHRLEGPSGVPPESLQIRVEFLQPAARAFPVLLLVRCAGLERGGLDREVVL